MNYSDIFTVKVEVTNNTQHPILKVEFKGVLKSPNRVIPWAEGTLRRKIPGGLEPGEIAIMEANLPSN